MITEDGLEAVKMKEIELPKSKELNLRHHGKIQYATMELEDGEIVEIKGVGMCKVKEVVKGLIELEKLKDEKETWGESD